MSLKKSVTSAQISALLLRWYDQNSRILPWRVPPSQRQANVMPNPYHVWLSEIMLQQTAVVTVIPYFNNFLSKWPRVHDLANEIDEKVLAAWAGLGYYARARNMIKTARIVSQNYSGNFPQDEAALLALPGIGPYTAGAIQAIAFDKPALVMDGNIERVMARLFDVHVPLPECKPVLANFAKSATPKLRPGDYVQAAMDLGATLCKPRNPNCQFCPLALICKAKLAGTAAQLPKKRPKKAKPTRYGIVYFCYTKNRQILLEKRPDKGLLGGMQGLPTSEWVETVPKAAPPLKGNWLQLPDPVVHIFTHFRLELTVMVAKTNAQLSERGVFVYRPDPNSLPTVMRKAYEMAMNTTQVSKILTQEVEIEL